VHGSASSTKFHVGFHKPDCSVSIKGTLPGGGPDLVGSFKLFCPSFFDIETHFKGTFDLVRDDSGCP
jgi:hypothetical protein